jgi:cytochrome c2
MTQGRRIAALALLFASVARAALPLLEQPSSPYDLAVSGELSGVPHGAVRYVRWSDLRSLSTTVLPMDGEFVPGGQEVTVVFLGDLWKALPVSPGADCMLATCVDRYASVFTSAFLARYRPFLVLEINGTGPDKWPPKGLDYNPGPYAITVSDRIAPAASGYLDLSHKKPWGVSGIEIAEYSRRFSDAYRGRWAALSERAAAGREIWINACDSCHLGPGRIFSGNQSRQAFAVLSAIARGDPALFRKYVRDPKSVISTAKMEPHPHYSDAQLDSIIAFVEAEQR